jgi:hypothetical protein
LTLDNGYLEAISENPESFMGSDVVFLGQHNNAAGTVAIGISRKAGQGGVSGTGNVARVRELCKGPRRTESSGSGSPPWKPSTPWARRLCSLQVKPRLRCPGWSRCGRAMLMITAL